MRILSWARTEKAKEDRRRTGTNSFRDKYLTYGNPNSSNTITTVLKDNLLLVRL